jgi:hypothetical protein
VEVNEVNIFCLLLTTAMDAIIEYTNESLASKGLLSMSYGEFHQFLVTLLLSSSFNTSASTSLKIMEACTRKKNTTRERFIQVLCNLRVYDGRRRVITAATSNWIDQRNRLDHLHSLEKKWFNIQF